MMFIVAGRLLLFMSFIKFTDIIIPQLIGLLY